MRFRYSSYEVDPSPTLPGGVVYRPEVTIDVIGPRRIETIKALAALAAAGLLALARRTRGILPRC